jgi:hypothetical protein
MTDDEGGPPALPPAAAPSYGDDALGGPPSDDDAGGGGGGAGAGGGQEVWETPEGGFEAFVAEVVRRRLGKYEQPDHPARLSRDQAASLFRQLRREVLGKEAAAFKERQRAGVHKPIERRKLEPRIKDFVRDSVRRWHTAQRGAA